MKSNSLNGFSKWEKLVEQILNSLPFDKGVYALRFQENFGGLRGKSDILYIGSSISKKGIKSRVRFYFKPGPTQTTSKRICSFIKGQYAEKVQIAWMNTAKSIARSTEKQLLIQYFKDHDELPPWNRTA